MKALGSLAATGAERRRESVRQCPRCGKRPVGGYVQSFGYLCAPCANAVYGIDDR